MGKGMVAAVKTYQVEAKRHGKWWGLYVPEVPGAISQVRTLADAGVLLDISPQRVAQLAGAK